MCGVSPELTIQKTNVVGITLNQCKAKHEHVFRSPSNARCNLPFAGFVQSTGHLVFAHIFSFPSSPSTLPLSTKATSTQASESDVQECIPEPNLMENLSNIRISSQNLRNQHARNAREMCFVPLANRQMRMGPTIMNYSNIDRSLMPNAVSVCK